MQCVKFHNFTDLPLAGGSGYATLTKMPLTFWTKALEFAIEDSAPVINAARSLRGHIASE